jgi:hypothetical protein
LRYLNELESLFEPLQGLCKFCERPTKFTMFDNKVDNIIWLEPFCNKCKEYEGIYELNSYAHKLGNNNCFISLDKREIKREIGIFKKLEYAFKFLPDLDLPNLKKWYARIC